MTRRTQTMADVLGDHARGQWAQIETVRDALAQLANARIGQMCIQLGLSEQHDLQQFFAFGFQIGKQTDFFQRVERHALRFLDEHHHAAIFCMARQQQFLQRLLHLQARRSAGERHMQIRSDGKNNIVGVDARI